MRLYQKPDVNVLTKLLSNPLLINGLSNSLPFAMVVPNVITKGTSLCQPTKKKKKKGQLCTKCISSLGGSVVKVVVVRG